MHMSRIVAQKGFSLIEVMVSVVLLTASMLGLAALQNASTKFDHQAYLRTQSVIQVGDMIDRMRANPVGASNGHYVVSPAPKTYETDCNLVASTCSAEELATFDIVVWNQQNATLLPGGIGAISGYTSTSTYMVAVGWTEQEDEKTVGGDYKNPCDDSTKESFHCYQLEVRL